MESEDVNGVGFCCCGCNHWGHATNSLEKLEILVLRIAFRLFPEFFSERMFFRKSLPKRKSVSEIHIDPPQG